jgi:hypothetical protein
MSSLWARLSFTCACKTARRSTFMPVDTSCDWRDSSPVCCTAARLGPSCSLRNWGHGEVDGCRGCVPHPPRGECFASKVVVV